MEKKMETTIMERSPKHAGSQAFPREVRRMPRMRGACFLVAPPYGNFPK